MLEWIQSDAFLYSQAKFLWEILAAEWIFVQDDGYLCLRFEGGSFLQ